MVQYFLNDLNLNGLKFYMKIIFFEIQAGLCKI